MGPVLGGLVSSTFDKKRMTPHSEFSPGTIKLLLRYCQGIIFLLIQKPVGYMHDCQLEKILVCMALVTKKGRQKQKSCSYLVVNRENKRYIWHISIYIYMCVMQMFDLYIMYIYIYLLVLKSIILVQKMQGSKTQPGES